MRQGDRRAVARALSIIEDDPDAVARLSRDLLPSSGTARLIGITGPPGAGKSTLASQMVSHSRLEGAVGVVAVDPSSPFSGGALLGDRLRMDQHSTDPGVFVRSMASRGHLGGLARQTPHAVRVLEAWGAETVLVETVGVGQSEVEIAGAADTVLVVVGPGFGDAIQAAKAGVLEIADILVVNKCDSPGAEDAARHLRGNLDLDVRREWSPPLVLVSATSGAGLDDLWSALAAHHAYLHESGELVRRRERRLLKEVFEMVLERLRERAASLISDGALDELRRQLLDRQVDPFVAAEALYERVLEGPDQTPRGRLATSEKG